MKTEEKYKIAHEIAVTEVKTFVEYHLEKDVEEDKVIEDYPDLIEAVRLGLINFQNHKEPIFTLTKPIIGENASIEEIKFRTRITLSEQENIARGIDISKDSLKFINKMRAEYIRQPKGVLDKLGKFDLRVIEQTCSVF